MGFALPLFLGFLASSMGITPPGLINMTAAKVGLKEGRTPALIFSAGASLVVVFQALIAVLFAKFLDKHPEVIVLLREVGLAIFGALTIYFFVVGRKTKAEKKEIKLHSKKSRFFMGMLLSSLNFFPIPFYVFISLMLSSYQLFIFDKFYIYTFVLGSGLGAYFAFYCYIAFFKKMESRTQFILGNMNYIIGSVTGLVSVLTLLEILDYYFG